MDGRGVAPGAGTILNALATGTGSAFAIDLETEATVSLTNDGVIEGEIEAEPDADTTLIERCVVRTVETFGESYPIDTEELGARVTTKSDVPMASGLKSSSAAANATVLATIDALDLDGVVDPLEACRVGVRAARDVGVTATGAFDDASASMLGGITVTDNEADELLAHETADWHVLVFTPPKRSFSADADVEACRRIGPMAELVADLALDGRFGEAMTVNGFVFCSALEFPTRPLLEALPDTTGVSLSGTGPSYVAVGERDELEVVRERWSDRDGTTRLLQPRTDGARTI